MPGRRGFALLCCSIVLLQSLQQLPCIQAKRRPAHSHHHSTEAATGREQSFELPGGGHLEDDEEEDFSSIVPLEAAEQHFSLMPDRPAVEEEDAEASSPLSQLGEAGAPAKGAYGVFGHHKLAKSGLSHCTGEGMGQVRASGHSAGPVTGCSSAPGNLHAQDASRCSYGPLHSCQHGTAGDTCSMQQG